MNPVAVEAMKEIGVDIGNRKPKKRSKEMILQADLAITMGCGEDACPIVPNELRDWDLEAPQGKPVADVRLIRDEIKRRVESLIRD